MLTRRDIRYDSPKESLGAVARCLTSSTHAPYDEPIIAFRVLLRGYCEADERFRAASAQTDPIPGILALFEALNWAVALDDRVAEHWAPDGIKLAKPGKRWRERWCGDQTVGAIRFARNRVHHQWAEALEFNSGGPSPVKWSWRSTADLPPAPDNMQDREGRTAYDMLLAGRPAASALASVRDVYSELADLLEPNFTPHDNLDRRSHLWVDTNPRVETTHSANRPVGS